MKSNQTIDARPTAAAVRCLLLLVACLAICQYNSLAVAAEPFDISLAAAFSHEPDAPQAGTRAWEPLAGSSFNPPKGSQLRIVSRPVVNGSETQTGLQPADPLSLIEDRGNSPKYIFTSQPLSATEPPDVDSDTTAGSGNSGTSTYGKQPERPVERRQFLRTQSPLLKQGDWQLDVGLAYTNFQYNFPSIDPSGALTRVDLRRRTLVMPLAVRYGLNERTQVFANIPVGWRNTEFATAPLTTPFPTDVGTGYFGIGDIQLGANYLLRRGCDLQPDIVVSFTGGLPTGEKAGLTNVFQGGLGTGFGAFAGQVLFIHTYDPIAVYWGGGYNYYIPGKVNGIDVMLGGQAVYQLGVGFAVNDRVTLSSAFLGSYIDQTSLNGVRIPNTQQEPARQRFAVTILRNGKIIEPFAEIGMSNSSPAGRIGIVWTF